MPNYTKSQLRILKAANAAFLAMKADNPDLWYDSGGGHLMTLRFANGTVLDNVRPDCSGMMRAIIMYMGYDMPGTWTGAWYGHTTNDIIKDKNGGYSRDWVVKTFDPSDRQPGDILVTSGHTDMFVFIDSNNALRGFNAGAGNYGSSVSPYGMQYSVNLAEYYQSTGSWTGGGSNVGGYTITETQGVTLIRFVGEGSDEASSGRTFTTNLDIYDVSSYQESILHDFDPATTGGLIIQVCRIRSYGVGTETAGGMADQDMTRVFVEFVNEYMGVIPLGFYFYSYLPYTTSEGNSKDAIRKCIQFMESAGVNPDNAELGVWIDLEDVGPTPVSPETNIKQVKWFCEVVKDRGYRTGGLYSGQNYINTHFNDADLANIPLWVAWWGQTPAGVAAWATTHGFTKVYLLQDSESYQVSGQNVDHDVIIQPIPYGINDYDYDEGGTSDTGAGTYQIEPAKKIIFTPEPGIIVRNQIVTVETDAPNAKVYVTTDNSVPDYSKPSQDWTNRRFTFSKSYHLRAYAFDSAGTIVAKGAATYTVPWIRPNDENLDELLAEFQEHKEVSVQPHLLYHTEDEKE